MGPVGDGAMGDRGEAEWPVHVVTQLVLRGGLVHNEALEEEEQSAAQRRTAKHSVADRSAARRSAECLCAAAQKVPSFMNP